MPTCSVARSSRCATTRAARSSTLLQLAARLKQEKREHREVRHLAGRIDRADLREGQHPDPHRVRGRGLRPGRPRDVPRADGQPRRQEGVGQGHGARPRPGLRRDRVPRLPPGGRRGARRSTRACPVYNGLTDEDHPTQVLADLLTIREHVAKPLAEVALAYVGDAHSNMGDELLIGCATMGMDLRIVAPSGRLAARGLPRRGRRSTRPCERRADHRHRGHRRGRPRRGRGLHGRVGLDGRARGGLGRAHRAAPPVPGGRRDDGRHRQARTSKFMHCLPAFHDLETEVGRKMFERHGLTAMEVTDEVFESPSIDRVRPGREPDAHDQGRAGRHAEPGRGPLSGSSRPRASAEWGSAPQPVAALR